MRIVGLPNALHQTIAIRTVVGRRKPLDDLRACVIREAGPSSTCRRSQAEKMEGYSMTDPRLVRLSAADRKLTRLHSLASSCTVFASP